MQVLSTTHELGINGASLAIPEIAARLTTRGDRIDVLVPEEVTGPLQGLIESAGGRVIRAANIKTGYDVALVNTILNAQMVSSMAPHMPVVWYIHEAEAGFDWLLKNSEGAAAFQAATHVILYHPHCRDTVFAPFLRHFPQHAVSIIPSGADIPPPDAPVPRAHEKDGRGILFVGTPYSRKRPVDLMSAFLAFCDGAPPLRIVGDSSYLDPDARPLLKRAPDRFQFLGVLDWPALRAEYERASILSLPSGSESMGRVTMEAALHGCALVLSDLPVHKGVWRDGKSALLHSVGDQPSLGLALRRLLDHPEDRIRLAEAARMVALNYPKEQSLDRVLMVLDRVTRAHQLSQPRSSAQNGVR
ncbi:glycosyltransferase family 4 protein [Rhodospirillum sp. A1_3_36]|uniref:glycosyltransferase family 4 protein n=1 Tax=Rhodospirillum sp. A1_3_36 TaxID=3391666 RepID=UPI0039A56755